MSSVSTQQAGGGLWLPWGLAARWVVRERLVFPGPLPAGMSRAFGLLAKVPSQHPLPLSPEDVFVQQTQDVRNPVIYAVFTSSG